MEKLLRAAKKLDKGSREEDGTIVRKKIFVPPAFEKDKAVPIEIGDAQGAQLELVWPPFATPTPQETQAKVAATSQAKIAGILSPQTAVRHIASDFDIEDVIAELEAIRKAIPATPDLADQSIRDLQNQDEQ